MECDILLKGGHLIDPKNDRDGTMDLAIKDGKVAAVAVVFWVDEVAALEQDIAFHRLSLIHI